MPTKAWGVFREGPKGFSLDVVWPTRKQADESANYCSYPVRVWPVEVDGAPRRHVQTPTEWAKD